jgi:phenylalanyl-tRNA synthetase beta chain
MKAPLSWMREYAPIGDDARGVAARLADCGFEVASIEGEVIDFEITANRPDCLSVYGLAREAATAFDVDLAPPPGSGDPAGPSGAPPILVSVADAGCGRYALALAEVRVGPSPEWLASRLIAAGVRPINNVVDVTNYVMLEMGHPMHAFDVARLGGPEIRVRRARPGERLTTLDGQDRALDDTMLVIADRDRPVAVAGVMGGAASEVSSATTHIAIESAWFLPSAVRLTSRRLGLKTEASARFERGADIGAPVRALRRALALLQQTGAGKPSGAMADVYPRPVEARYVELRRSRVARLLGAAVPDADIARLLGRLGFATTAADAGWRVQVPSFRVDVTREADLIEEVGRHWGFNRIPSTFPPLRDVPRPAASSIARDRTLRRVLAAAGLQEASTFTFIDERAAAAFVADASALVRIANPLSENFAVLRPSLLAGLLDAVVHNRHRQIEDVRLFEIGSVFGPAGERACVAWVLAGARDRHWSAAATGANDVDEFDAIGVAEVVGRAFGADVEAVPDPAIAWLTPGRAAALVARREDGATPIVIGSAGRLNARVIAARGLGARDRVIAAEIDLAALAEASRPGIAPIVPLPRFPAIVRDLSLLVDERLPAADLRGTIRAHAARSLVEIREFDRYRGKGVPDGQIGLSVRLTFRDPDRTLTDAEAQQAVDAIVQALERTHGARLRGS